MRMIDWLVERPVVVACNEVPILRCKTFLGRIVVHVINASFNFIRRIEKDLIGTIRPDGMVG